MIGFNCKDIFLNCRLNWIDQTKAILFSKTRGLREINISFVGHFIKQRETVEYLGCQLDSKLSGEAMASKVLKK